MKVHQSTVILLLVIFGMHEEDFTTVIENRQINEQGKCRKLNTFIKSKENERDYKANGFDVIDCVRNEQGGKCKYTGIPENGFQITLTCKKGKPVHYIGSRPNQPPDHREFPRCSRWPVQA
uniref:Uncharacterized protein n=1 Tax=Sinocyclocheilus rhinocerous TaxID=307959 RepID=A0A673FP27_9TELE